MSTNSPSIGAVRDNFVDCSKVLSNLNSFLRYNSEVENRKYRLTKSRISLSKEQDTEVR